MSERYSDLVIDFIRKEGLGAGSRLPAEMEMAETLGLSRNSVREAYVDLITRGLIRRKHGVGTFVSEPPILNSLGGSVGFWSLIERSGRTPSLSEITRGPAVPPADIANLYGLGAGKPIDRMRWLFAANGQPCILIDHYPAPGIPLEIFDVSAHTVTRRTHGGVYLGRFFCMNGFWPRSTRMTDSGRPASRGTSRSATASR